MKKILSLLLTLAMVLALAACGGSKPEPTYNDAGYYAIFSLTDADGTMDQDDFDTLDWTMYLELRENGTGVLDMGDGDPTELTWQDGSISAMGETIPYSLAGGMLTLDLSDDDSDFVMIFKKGERPSGNAPVAAEPEAAPAEKAESAPADKAESVPAAEDAAPAGQTLDLNSLMGAYKLTYMDNEGEIATEDDLATMESLGFIFELRLQEDGTGSLLIFGESIGSIQWDDSGIAIEGQTFPSTFEDGVLTLSWEGTEMEFTKVSDDPDAVIEAGTDLDSLAGLGALMGAVSGTDNIAGTEAEPDTADRAADAGPLEISQLPVSGDIRGVYHYAIVGAEAFKDSDDEDAVRFYYEFTNNSDASASAWWSASLDAEQGGNELDYAFAPYTDSPPEDGNGDLYVQPGITIRCVEEFAFDPDGGELVFTISDFGDDPVTAVFDPADLPGAPAEPWSIQPIDDPRMYSDYPRSASTDNVDVEIIDAEIVPSYWDDAQVLRVYFTLTNKTEKDDTPWWLLTITAFQDGVSLDSGTPEDSVEADDLFSETLSVGKTVTFAQTWELRSDSPVEVVVDDYYAYADEPVAAAIMPIG